MTTGLTPALAIVCAASTGIVTTSPALATIVLRPSLKIIDPARTSTVCVAHDSFTPTASTGDAASASVSGAIRPSPVRTRALVLSVYADQEPVLRRIADEHAAGLVIGRGVGRSAGEALELGLVWHEDRGVAQSR